MDRSVAIAVQFHFFRNFKSLANDIDYQSSLHLNEIKSSDGITRANECYSKCHRKSVSRNLHKVLQWNRKWRFEFSILDLFNFSFVRPSQRQVYTNACEKEFAEIIFRFYCIIPLVHRLHFLSVFVSANTICAILSRWKERSKVSSTFQFRTSGLPAFYHYYYSAITTGCSHTARFKQETWKNSEERWTRPTLSSEQSS